MSTKKWTKWEPRSLQWDWVEDLYLSQEKKLNHTLLSFEAASPQIYSCRLLLSSESVFQLLGTQTVCSLGCGISPYLLRKQSHGVVRVTA